jgi:hypothetical protein
VRRIVLLFSLMALMGVVAAGVAWAELQEGTAGPDTLQGTAQADQQFGRGGQDVLNGRGGNDNQNGGGGPDTIRGQAGNDTQKGGRGGDTIIGGPGDDTVLNYVSRVAPTVGAIWRAERIVVASALLLVLIHRSAWKMNSRQYEYEILHRLVPSGRECALLRLLPLRGDHYIF